MQSFSKLRVGVRTTSEGYSDLDEMHVRDPEEIDEKDSSNETPEIIVTPEIIEPPITEPPKAEPPKIDWKHYGLQETEKKLFIRQIDEDFEESKTTQKRRQSVANRRQVAKRLT